MRIKSSTILLVSVLAASACNNGGGSEGKGEVAPGEDPVSQPPQCDAAAGKVAVGGECQDVNTETTEENQLELLGGELDVQLVQTGKVALTTALVGQAEVNETKVELESLQYRFQSIQICEDMQVQGTGFSNPKNCLEIFREAEADKANYGNLPPERSKFSTQQAFDAAVATYETEVKARHAAALADTKHYIDLMDPKAIAKLSAKLKLSAKDAHKYSFGLVNWYRPIKVKASVPLIGSSPAVVVYTKEGEGAVEITGSDSYIKHVTKGVDMTTGPAELAVVEHPNGGAWFRFPKPFEITKKDIEAKRNFKLKLTFNPDGIAKAFDDKYSGTLKDETNDVSFSIPMLQLTPIAHGTDQVVQKEVYKLERQPPSGEPFYGRIELYSIKNDPSKAVYGVASQVLYGTGSTTSVMDMPQAFFLDQVTVSGKNFVVMKDYQQVEFLKLPRQTVLNTAESVNVTSQCKDGHPGFILPEHQPMDCMATPNQSVTDAVSVKLEKVVDLP